MQHPSEPPLEDFYLFAKGQQSGPHTAANIRSLLSSGLIQGDTLAWQAACGDWRPLSQMIEIAPVISAPPPLPVPAKRQWRKFSLITRMVVAGGLTLALGFGALFLAFRHQIHHMTDDLPVNHPRPNRAEVAPQKPVPPSAAIGSRPIPKQAQSPDAPFFHAVRSLRQDLKGEYVDHIRQAVQPNGSTGSGVLFGYMSPAVNLCWLAWPDVTDKRILAYRDVVLDLAFQCPGDSNKLYMSALEHPDFWGKATEAGMENGLRRTFDQAGVPEETLVAGYGELNDAHLALPTLLESWQKNPTQDEATLLARAVYLHRLTDWFFSKAWGPEERMIPIDWSWKCFSRWRKDLWDFLVQTPAKDPLLAQYVTLSRDSNDVLYTAGYLRRLRKGDKLAPPIDPPPPSPPPVNGPNFVPDAPPPIEADPAYKRAFVLFELESHLLKLGK